MKSLGGDGVTTATARTADQTQIGLFWAYDGAPGLGVPPRLFNQIVRTIAVQEGNTVVENARLFALINIAQSDAGTGAWLQKYVDDVWRPILGIRESDPGTGPSGLGDGNAATIGDPTWTPLGAPSTNTDAPNFTPNFPSYVSGHATFGSAVFQTLINFYGRNDIAFTFTSDELNGVNRDGASGAPRPLAPRSYATLRQAEHENADSRVYLGIHWRFDQDEGVLMGRGVANEVCARVALPADEAERENADSRGPGRGRPDGPGRGRRGLRAGRPSPLTRRILPRSVRHPRQHSPLGGECAGGSDTSGNFARFAERLAGGDGVEDRRRRRCRPSSCRRSRSRA